MRLVRLASGENTSSIAGCSRGDLLEVNRSFERPGNDIHGKSSAGFDDRRRYLGRNCAGRVEPPALAETNGFEGVIKQFAGGRTRAQGRVNLDLPKIADDGASVPMTITIDSPMTEESRVTDVLVVAEGNPRPRVAIFHFSPASGVAEVSTRIRSAQTENVVAIAKMNDGSVLYDEEGSHRYRRRLRHVVNGRKLTTQHTGPDGIKSWPLK